MAVRSVRSASGMNDLIVGLDIGTSKVVAIVGRAQPTGELEVIGVGAHPSAGMKKGVIVNIDATVLSIQRAIEEAELMAGCQVNAVYAGIADSHVRGINSNGVVAIRDREVQSGDLERVIDAAQAVAIPADQRVLHILPQEYLIDNQEGIREPRGMSGVRLEAKVHLVTCAVNAAQNIEKCVGHCGLQAQEIISAQLASSYAVLTEDEKELGVCMVDIGSGTTDIAVFSGGAIRHTAVIPIAGDQVTNDIAMALRTPTQHVEDIKLKHACALMKQSGLEETIQVHSVGDRPPRVFTRYALAEVVEPRYEELFSLVHAELKRSGFEALVAAGIVLTGGSSKIEGAIELAERVFHMPVRLAEPHPRVGLDKSLHDGAYATAVGLLLYGHKHRLSGLEVLKPTTQVKDLMLRVKDWVKGNF